MLYFWLLLSIASAVVVTFMGFKEGFNRWTFYYSISISALLMFFAKRWMMKRFEKHMEYLKNQEKNS